MKASSSGGGGVKKPHEMTYNVLKFRPEDPDAKDLFTTRCTTVEEKYRLLEARDKVLRARVPKVKVRVEFATRLFGTCPDMCPEKERYMRQYQRQLTSFEIDANSMEVVVDHKKAIKAYSRSSADQDEPLPHELRHVTTLKMTLDYLLRHIVPLADNNEDLLGDWYNFLWDRTRSIRKDITQQQLTNLCVVSLMEKCARFHIHCSSRLCELDVHQFDPKLNDENLMKCLQSLEHLYDDLRRRDVKCPNEPEFRAYQIMMNLNEGDILLSIQQRPEWIVKSPEVQAAIKVHHYIFSKNFVAFFRLVKSFPYMFSCILQRYFYQVRYRALSNMCRSSAGRKGDVQLILSQVQRMLGYGDGTSLEFKNFCELHGLVVQTQNDKIVYNRKPLVRPDSIIISREYNLIESKLTTTTAEAVNGGVLPDDPIVSYTPHTSFDDDGFLKPGLVAGDTSAGAVIIVPKIEHLQSSGVINVPDAFAVAAIEKTKMPGFMSKSTSDAHQKPKMTSKFRLNEKVFKTISKSLTPSPFDLGQKLKSSSSVLKSSTSSNTFGAGPPSIFGGSTPDKSSSGASAINRDAITTPTPAVFGGTTSTPIPAVFSGITSTPTPPVFGGTPTPAVFGGTTSTPTPAVFGGTTSTPTPAVFGGTTSSPTPAVFGGTTSTPTPAVFGGTTSTPTPALFGGTTSTPTPAVFGGTTGTPTVFGGATTTPHGTTDSSATVFKSPFEGKATFTGNFENQPLFGGNSSFTNANLLPTTVVPPPVQVEDDSKTRKLQLIDSVCDKALDTMLQTFIGQELKLAVSDTIKKNIAEREMQEKLYKKQALRSQLAEQASEKILDRVVPRCVLRIIQEEVQQHLWLQSVCELYATKAIESIVTRLVEPICLATLIQQEAENKQILHRATIIFRRLKFRLIINKWRAYAKQKQLRRKRKEEKLLQDMLNFPAANSVGRSPKEMLQHIRGNGTSPNIIKTLNTKPWLDKYERVESLAQNFKNSVFTFVKQLYKSPELVDVNKENPLRPVNKDYNRHCWKRRWPSTQTMDSEIDGAAFGGRRNKSPRLEYTTFTGNPYTPSPHQFRRKNQSLTNINSVINDPQPPTKSAADELLDQIRKFSEEAKKEKENFKKSEIAIADEFIDESIFQA